jgi:hypothetical protein
MATCVACDAHLDPQNYRRRNHVKMPEKSGVFDGFALAVFVGFVVWHAA